MEYCYGGDFEHLLKRMKKLTEEQAKFYFCEIALALEYIHSELNMIYRDLKPSNILIDTEGHIKLCDFGLSVPIIDENYPHLSEEYGNPYYRAPELVDISAGHSTEVDWWALGIISNSN